MSIFLLMRSSSNKREYVIDGLPKHYSNWLAATFLVLYFAAIVLLFPPFHELSVLLWLYCIIFIVLIIYSPKWWLWGTIITICVLGFVPSLYGVFNKHLIDGSILSIAHIHQIQATGLKGRVISLPLLGLPPSIFIWWLRNPRVVVPRSFIPIAVFCAMMIGSSLCACMKYVDISFLPFNFNIIVPENFDKLSYARQWWQAGMPYSLMAFTLTFCFASVFGSMLLLVVYDLLSRISLLDDAFSALSIAVLISICYGLAQMNGLVPVFTSGGNLESTFQSQGSYGVFVGIGCVLLLSRSILSDNRVGIYGLLFVFSLLGLFINQSRTALVALAISPILIYAGHLFLTRKGVYLLRSSKKKVVMLLIAMTLISSFALSIPSLNKYVLQSCRNHFIVSTVQSFDFDRGLDRIFSGRMHIWAECMEIWYENPIFGCGQGQLYWELKARRSHDTAANQFILVLAEMGIIGFGLFLWVILSIFRDLAEPIFSKRDEYDYISWLICCSLVVCLLVQSFTVHVLHFPNLPLLIGVIVAMALASSRTRSELSEG